MKKRGFTLVELMIVIAIIGVLVGLLFPVISGANKKALASLSKTMIVNVVTGLERYKDEYGYFPKFLTQRERTNLNDGSNSESLVKALTGKDPDGRTLSQSDRREFNRKSRNFVEFNAQNLVQKTQGGQWKVVDSFGNPNIYICVDDDDDGFIKQGFPTVADGFSPTEAREIVPNPQMGLRAKVIAFTLKKDANKPAADFSADDIFSWY